MSRPVGVPNKASGAVRELAQKFGPEIIQRLADIAGLCGSAGSEFEMTRITAMRELLDRGFGKATQPIGGQDGGPLRMVVYTGVFRDGDPSDEDRGADAVGR
jgi:hypothetical protein